MTKGEGGYHLNIEERREVTCYLHGLEGGGGRAYRILIPPT